MQNVAAWEEEMTAPACPPPETKFHRLNPPTIDFHPREKQQAGWGRRLQILMIQFVGERHPPPPPPLHHRLFKLLLLDTTEPVIAQAALQLV